MNGRAYFGRTACTPLHRVELGNAHEWSGHDRPTSIVRFRDTVGKGNRCRAGGQIDQIRHVGTGASTEDDWPNQRIQVPGAG